MGLRGSTSPSAAPGQPTFRRQPSSPAVPFVLLFLPRFVAGAPSLLGLGLGRGSQGEEIHNGPGSWHLRSSSGPQAVAGSGQVVRTRVWEAVCLSHCRALTSLDVWGTHGAQAKLLQAKPWRSPFPGAFARASQSLGPGPWCSQPALAGPWRHELSWYLTTPSVSFKSSVVPDSAKGLAPSHARQAKALAQAAPRTTNLAWGPGMDVQ